jgi:hypothetical protein
MSKKTTPQIVLPRKDKDGNYYISYSQISTFNDLQSYNLKLLGKIEYMAAYFFGDSWPDSGFAQFGLEVEDYICNGAFQENFSDRERAVLDNIEPLGNFQVETKIWLFPNVYIKGFIDDSVHDLTHIRDYKTASKNSKAKYYKDSYVQLDIYAMHVLQETGKLPEKIEVCIIERTGNCFGMVNRRDLLKVGEEVWYHTRETSMERIETIKAELRTAVYKISELYQLYLKLNKIPTE